MGNILKNHVECTCEEFVAEVAGRRRKPYLDALKSTFNTLGRLLPGQLTLDLRTADGSACCL